MVETGATLFKPFLANSGTKGTDDSDEVRSRLRKSTRIAPLGLN